MIAPDVRAGWVGFSTPLEGCIPHLYLDTKGLVTVAIGALVDSPGAAAALSGWSDPGGVTADWYRVKAMDPGRAASHYAGGPQLTPEGIAAVTTSRLDAAGVALLHAFPAFYDWPAPAQAAALSLAWACGAGWPASWPRLSRFCSAASWMDAAGDCQINAVGNPGVMPRSEAQRVLFLLAGGTALAEALSTIPAGPTGGVARRALAAFPFCLDQTATLPTGAAAT